MANRYKPVSHEAWQAEQAILILAASRRLDWRRWSATRQVEYLFDTDAATVAKLCEQVGADYALARLHQACMQGQSVVERARRQRALLELAKKRTAVLQRVEIAAAVAALVAHYPWRLRELTNWLPKSKNVYRQLESLVRHLFDQYGDVPAWVLNAWTANQMSQSGVNIAELTIHIGRGHSLRSFPDLPVPLTKKLEHEMRQAPVGCTFLEALRYAQLATHDALAWLGPVLATRLGREIGPDDAFWLGVVDFFAVTPMVDPRHFGPVCDWIYQKRSVGIGNEPPQPGFSLKGRTMANVLVQMEQWHRGLAHVRRHAGQLLSTTWTMLPVTDFTSGDDQRVCIHQLRTYGELVAEGSVLCHCVASYLHSCQKGYCGIFSLKIDGARTITLEVQRNRVIVQARGRYNRPMRADERHWVNRWASEAQLTLSKYL